LPETEIAPKEETKMEFYHDAVRVLETLAKALSGAFGADWRCEKRRTNAPALSVGGWYAAGVQSFCVTGNISARPSVPSLSERTSKPRNQTNYNKLFLKIRRNILWISLTLL